MRPAQLGSTDFREVEADVVVLGGGIVGMTTALLLQSAGRQVVVIEAERLGRSVTAHSTVKVTVGHGTQYSKIEEGRGFDAAAAYATANLAGFDEIVRLAESLELDCMLEHGPPHVVYAETAQEATRIEREADVAQRLGLPVSMTEHAPVPFDVTAALSFDGQAHFHPARYLVGLAEAFVREGGVVFEGTRAHGVDEKQQLCHVETTAGPLSAPYVVVATQYPILDRGGQFARMRTQRSYGVAGVLPEGVPAGMTINSGSPTHSTRTVNLQGDELLIVVGEGHAVGNTRDTAQRWSRLQHWARDRFGVEEFRYHWSAQETYTFDYVPFAGFIAPGSRRVLTATGFHSWGMTNGTASAMLMRDLVLGRDNPWAATFDARRAETRVPGREDVTHNVRVGVRWLKDRVGRPPKGSPEQLEPGEAAILNAEGKQSAVYRDEHNNLHAVSPVCTHMACNVEWNAGEKSWDCPCHGSRFSPNGAVLQGPASKPLPKRDVQ